MIVPVSRVCPPFTFRAIYRCFATSSGSGIDYDSFLSKSARARVPSPIRALTPLMAIPGMISLGGGLPNPSTFPFQSLAVTMSDGSTLPLDGAALKEALQYSPTEGLPSLLSHARNLLATYHAPPVPTSTIVTTGSQDALYKIMSTLLDPGDTVIIEAPSYPGTLSILRPLGAHIVSLPVDADGLPPQLLQRAIADAQQQGRRVKAICIIPNGQNPSGCTMSSDRRRQVYQIARESNVMIVEDDPYYFIQYGAYLPSFLSLDVDGRVIRTDSFSKVLSAGLRVGLLSGPAPLIARVTLMQQASALHTSGISQALLASVLTSWGSKGWDKHVAEVQGVYSRRRDWMLGFCERHLKDNATWTSPAAGMFLWLKLTHIRDSRALIQEKARERKVLLVPGADFASEQGAVSSHVRASFSTASAVDMEEAVKRLGQLLEENRDKL